MKILKKEVIYLNEKEEEAINLLKQLCLAISNQSITYELVEIAEKTHYYLTSLEDYWVVKDLNNTCCDNDDDDEEDNDEDNDWLL